MEYTLHSSKKCFSSSISPPPQGTHTLSSRGVFGFLCLPLSIARGWFEHLIREIIFLKWKGKPKCFGRVKSSFRVLYVLSLEISSLSCLFFQLVSKYADMLDFVVSFNFFRGTPISFKHLTSFSIVTIQFVRIFAFSISAFFARDLSGRVDSLQGRIQRKF